MALQPAFIWGAGGKRMTPEEIQRERQVLEALTGRVDTSPVGHWTQGAARVVDALGGVMRERRADAAESQNNAESQSRIAALLSGMGGGSSAPMTSQQPSTASLMQPGNAQPGGMTSYRDAIASIESAGSGDYAAVGPTHPRLGRALGRYQVMEANIGPWSEKHLGRRITADEFMADPALQDAIFDGEFGSYVQRYGPEGAAQAWFGGPGGVGKTDRRDSLGTSIGAYGEKFNRALGTQPNADMGLATQAAMASADPMQALNTRNVVENPRAVTMPEIAEGVGQYVPRSGFIGANSDMPGAITYDDQGMRPAGAPAPLADDAFNDRFGGAPQPAQAFDAVMPTDPMQTSAMPAAAPPVDPMRAELQQIGTSLGSSQLANADPRQGILQVLMAQGSQGGQGEFPPAPGQGVSMTGGMGGGINPAIIASLSDPNASEQERRIASVMLEQELASQQAAQAQQMQMADPMRALELERMQLENESLRNPRPETTAEMQNLQWRAQQAGLQPGTQEYADFMMTGGRNDATNITVNTGEGDKFYETLDADNAKVFSALSEEGMRGQAKLAQIDRLDMLLQQAPSGAEAVFKQMAGEYGINTDGLGEIQAAQALINELVPQQRQPGSGPMSDADLALFKQSLPRIINQPGANQMIVQTMRGITQYQIQMGQIADAVANREISPQQGREAIRNLENPLAGFGDRVGGMMPNTPAQRGGRQPVVIDGFTIEEVE